MKRSSGSSGVESGSWSEKSGGGAVDAVVVVVAVVGGRGRGRRREWSILRCIRCWAVVFMSRGSSMN